MAKRYEKNEDAKETKKSGKGRNSKNRKNNSRSNRNDSHAYQEEKVTPRGGMNDASWYAYNPQLLADTASIAYSWPLGNKLDFDLHADGLANVGVAYKPVGSEEESISGVIAIGCTACPGISRDNASAINITARNIYSNVRYANSGHSNYNSPDLMIYLLAMDSAYSMLSYAQRVYGVARTYSQENRYYPRAILTAMGVDPDSIQNNLANFRAALNVAATKINAMFVPNAFNYYTRHWWMYSGLYTDAVGAKAQTYLFYPTSYYKYDPVKYTTGGALTRVEWYKPNNYDPKYHPAGDTVAKLKTWTDIIDMLEGIIFPLVTSEDLNIMSGDIFKAYGSSGLMRVPIIEENFTVLPQLNAEVLLQINNLVAIGSPTFATVQTDDDTFDRRDIYQQPDGAIIWYPIWEENSPGYMDRWMLNMPIDYPTPADTMVATRLTNIAHNVDAVTWDNGERTPVIRYEFHSMGSDYVDCINIIKMGYDHDGNWMPVYCGFADDNLDGSGDIVSLTSYLTVAPSSISGSYAVVTAISKFNYHPTIIPITWNYEDECYYRNNCLCNAHTIAMISEHDLEKMHQTAMLSLFSVPNFVGKK